MQMEPETHRFFCGAKKPTSDYVTPIYKVTQTNSNPKTSISIDPLNNSLDKPDLSKSNLLISIQSNSSNTATTRTVTIAKPAQSRPIIIDLEPSNAVFPTVASKSAQSPSATIFRIARAMSAQWRPTIFKPSIAVFPTFRSKSGKSPPTTIELKSPVATVFNPNIPTTNKRKNQQDKENESASKRPRNVIGINDDYSDRSSSVVLISETVAPRKWPKRPNKEVTQFVRPARNGQPSMVCLHYFF